LEKGLKKEKVQDAQRKEKSLSFSLEKKKKVQREKERKIKKVASQQLRKRKKLPFFSVEKKVQTPKKVVSIEKKFFEKIAVKIAVSERMTEKITFNIDKEKNFSEWFTEIISKAELADIRYNVKGFIVFMPWSVLCMEEIYKEFEKALQRKNHKPYWFPAVIPEENFYLEKEHVEGFAPEVFWITEHGNKEKLEERLALRPTSETAFYKMFSFWIQSYKDLPLKTYQRAQVWRYETKATRPFIRSREFYWIEAHCAFASEEQALNQVKEDMQTVEEVMHQKLGIPFIFFKRPEWDKFAGAVATFAADTLMPNGRVIQQPSTHFLGQNFSKPFNVKFKDKDEKEKFCFITCFGPAISRIFASVVAIHGDNKGLIFPFEVAPLQVIIVPINFEKEEKIKEKAIELKEKLFNAGIKTEIDFEEKRPGEKFYFWEMKGVPFRIELGLNEIKSKELTVFRRDTGKKIKVKEKELIEFILSEGKKLTENLKKIAEKKFNESIVNAGNKNELKKALEEKKIARVNFCSIENDGIKCAEVIEKEFNANIRGIRADKKEKAENNCIICGRKAKEIVYIAKQY